MKKIKLLVVVLISIIFLPFSVNAAEKDPIKVYIFKGDGCGYCAAALEFFESIEDEYGEYFDLVEYEVWYSEENATLMTEVASYFNEEVSGVPYIIIGETTFQGYAESYNEQIKTAIIKEYNNEDYVDIVKSINGGETLNTKKGNSNKTTIIIISVAIVGFIALFYFARDTEVEIETKENKVVENPKKEEVKKTASKNTNVKKTASTTKKVTTAKKTPTTKTAKKTPTKKQQKK